MTEQREWKVKPLEWHEGPSLSYIHIAQSPLGEYQVWEINGRGVWSNSSLPGVLAGTSLNDAKAAAQADYEQRILSALIPAEPPVAVAVKPIAYLVWLQGRRAVDDVEDYYEVARPGDKSIDGSEPFPVYATPPTADLQAEVERLRTLGKTPQYKRLIFCIDSFKDTAEQRDRLMWVDEVEVALRDFGNIARAALGDSQ